MGSRGFFLLDGPFAEFDPAHPSVEIWTPDSANAPVMVYAHGGAGYRADDRARVAMFRRNGFATTVPTLIPFGALDTWAGKSATDFVWKRRDPESTISIEDWVKAQQANGRPVEFVFYEDAGHLLFEGPLELVTVRRGEAIAFTAYQGAAEGVLEQYERDVMSFVSGQLAGIESY